MKELKYFNMKSLTMGWKVFALLILVVTIIQFSLLRTILQNGYTLEDWWQLFIYKTMGYDGDFLSKYILSLQTQGLYHTYQIMYVGILESLFKGNYVSYQITNIIFKILATISLYPLVLIIFKRRLLAFLTTILYAISYSSSGALYFICLGSDYLAIFFMNLFLISYYLNLSTRRSILLFISSFLLFFSFMLSPIRIYPVLGLVILIEVFVWLKSKRLLGFLFAGLRLLLLFLPFLIIFCLFNVAAGGQVSGPSTIANFLYYGNYQLLLSPLAGLGYTFLTNDYWPMFGQLFLDSFSNYLSFLLHGPVIIYSSLAILLGFLLNKRVYSFTLGIVLTNLFFQLLAYFLITNIRGATGPNVKGFYPVSTQAIFFGFFVLSIAFSSFFMWLRNKSNKLLLSLCLGPLFSTIFLWGLWLIKGDALTFKEGIHWYMVTPSIGSSLFLASLMILVYDKIRVISTPKLRSILIVFLFLILLPIYLISSKEINTTFTDLQSTGYKASDQEQMKNILLSYIKDPLDKNPALFYFEAPNQTFFPISLISGFEENIHFRNWEVVNGCVALIRDKSILEKSVLVRNGVKGFNASSLCVENSFEVSRPEMFYTPENLHAFRLKDSDVIDIKQKVLNELGFE